MHSRSTWHGSKRNNSTLTVEQSSEVRSVVNRTDQVTCGPGFPDTLHAKLASLPSSVSALLSSVLNVGFSTSSINTTIAYNITQSSVRETKNRPPEHLSWPRIWRPLKNRYQKRRRPVRNTALPSRRSSRQSVAPPPIYPTLVIKRKHSKRNTLPQYR